MKQRTLTNILLLALLAFNVGFLGSWWYGHWKAHRRMHKKFKYFGGHESKGGMFLVKELGLTDEQQNQLENLRKEHFQKVQLMEEGVARNEKRLMNALMANPADSVTANLSADSVGILKGDIQKELFDHFNNIKKMCTPEQSAKFDQLIEELSKEFPHHEGMYHNVSNSIHHDSI